MRYAQTIPPDASLAVVSAADAMFQANLDDPADVAYVQALVALATEFVEKETNRQLLGATWCCYLDAFPTEIQLERLPVQTIVQIEYTDTEGNSDILDPDQYQFDVASPDWSRRIQPAYGLVWPVTRGYSRTWPTIEANHLGELPEITGYYNAVQVTFTAGYGTRPTCPSGSSTPSSFWSRRGIATAKTARFGLQAMPIPQGVTRLLALADWGQYA